MVVFLCNMPQRIICVSMFRYNRLGVPIMIICKCSVANISKIYFSFVWLLGTVTQGQALPWSNSVQIAFSLLFLTSICGFQVTVTNKKSSGVSCMFFKSVGTLVTSWGTYWDSCVVTDSLCASGTGVSSLVVAFHTSKPMIRWKSGLGRWLSW